MTLNTKTASGLGGSKSPSHLFSQFIQSNRFIHKQITTVCCSETRYSSAMGFVWNSFLFDAVFHFLVICFNFGEIFGTVPH